LSLDGGVPHTFTSKTGVITLKNRKNISCASIVEGTLALVRLEKVRVNEILPASDFLI
jgi:hypothetical protein